jgi:hypothetical protein
MAGIGRPVFLGRLVAEIKKKYPKILVQYHGHSGPGFSVASMLEVARAGAEYIDVAMEPLSWGKIHPDVITIQAMLKDAGFLVKEINMDAYMEARHLTQTFIDDFLGYFIEPTNYQSSSLLVGCGLPGGMMGSMMADLQGFLGAINMSLKNQGKKEATLDELTVALFQEVEYVWPRLGYPPLVTPFSQYVKNTALMNLMHTLKGEPRWKTIDKDTMNMILGKTSDHGKNHIRTGLSLHLGGTPGRCFSIDRYSVDGYNHISGDHARLYCGRTRIGLDNQHSAVRTLLDKGTDASVGTRRHYFKIFSLFFRNVCSIGIERLEHRFDTDGYDFTIIYGINISFGKLFQYRILNLHILS